MEQLEYLIEISKHKSLNSASRALHLTPQALSMSIKQLEGELGYPVLYRSAVGATLTPQGRATAIQALNFLGRLRAIRESGAEASKPAPYAQAMPLMMPAGSAESYIPAFQAMLYKIAPKWQLDIVEAGYEQIIKSVLEGRVEIAITAQLTIDSCDALDDLPPQLQFVPFLHYRCFCYASHQFPIARYKSITLKSMLEYPIVLFEPARYIYGRIIEAVCPLSQAQIIWVTKSSMINEFIKNAICLSFALINENDHQFLVDMPPGTAITLKENILIHYGYLINTQKPLSPAAQTLADYLLIFYNQ